MLHTEIRKAYKQKRYICTCCMCTYMQDSNNSSLISSKEIRTKLSSTKHTNTSIQMFLNKNHKSIGLVKKVLKEANLFSISQHTTQCTFKPLVQFEHYCMLVHLSRPTWMWKLTCELNVKAYKWNDLDYTKWITVTYTTFAFTWDSLTYSLKCV